VQFVVERFVDELVDDPLDLVASNTNTASLAEM
jgi:hypothetical protein